MKDVADRILDADDVLAEYYDTDKHLLTSDDRKRLTPILNVLKNFHSRYQMLEEIGAGKEKVVSRVYDHRLGRSVAMARPVDASTAEKQEKFLREARLTASLSQSNILPIHNMGIDPEGIPFFTMELLPGDSLDDILTEMRNGVRKYARTCSLEELLNIFIKVCDAITYAHSCNVIHLDLKPTHIRIGEYGDVIVCDWGLAKVLNNDKFKTELEFDDIVADDLNDATLVGTMKGTPGFMSPEQARGELMKSPAADIYSLGAILYMILTLQTPVSGNSTQEILENTRTGNIIPPQKRGESRHIPKSLAAVAMKALALNPTDRYATALELKTDVLLYMRGYATDAEGAGPLKQAMLFCQRNSFLTFALLGFLVVLVTLSISGIMLIEQERKYAVSAKEESERHLELFKAEQATTSRLEKSNADIVNYLLDVPDLYHAAPTLAILEEQMQSNLPPKIRKDLLATKGVLHLILEQFNAAVTAFDQVPESNQAKIYLPICRKYAEFKPDDTQLLTETELFEMFRDPKSIKFNKTTLLYCYVNHIHRRPNPDAELYKPLASQLLEFINGMRRSAVEMIDLSHGENGYRLDLSDSKFTRLRIVYNMKKQTNILSPFELDHLDISHSSITDLQELGGIRVNELNMTGLRLKSEWPVPRVLRLSKVKRVFIDLENYTAKTRRQIRNICEVVDTSTGEKR